MEKSRLVNVKGPESANGEIVEVEIKDTKTWTLYGVMVKSKIEVY